jgi:hypothetical protein
LLPAGAKVAGRDSHPLENSAYARRTKHQGYHYEHAFALDWNAMRGYHLRMRLAHVFNSLARFTRQLRELYRQFGVRGAIAFIRTSCAGPWLDPARMHALLAKPFLLQLVSPASGGPATTPSSVPLAGKGSPSDRTGAPATSRTPLKKHNLSP